MYNIYFIKFPTFFLVVTKFVATLKYFPKMLIYKDVMKYIANKGHILTDIINIDDIRSPT